MRTVHVQMPKQHPFERVLDPLRPWRCRDCNGLVSDSIHCRPGHVEAAQEWLDEQHPGHGYYITSVTPMGSDWLGNTEDMHSSFGVYLYFVRPGTPDSGSFEVEGEKLESLWRFIMDAAERLSPQSQRAATDEATPQRLRLPLDDQGRFSAVIPIPEDTAVHRVRVWGSNEEGLLLHCSCLNGNVFASVTVPYDFDLLAEKVAEHRQGPTDGL